MQRLKNLADVVLSSPQIATVLGISVQRLGRLRQEGVIEQTAPGQWSLVQTTPRYVEHLRCSRRHDTSDAVLKLRAAQLEKLRLQNEREAEISIPFEDAQTAVQLISGAMKTAFGGLPRRATRLVSEQRKLEELVDACFSEAATEFDRQCKILDIKEMDIRNVLSTHGDTEGAWSLLMKKWGYVRAAPAQGNGQ